MSIRAIAMTATLLTAFAVPLIPAAASADSAPAPSLCAPPADTVGPIASSVTFARKSIDLDTGSRVEQVTVDASDTSGDGTASGVAAVRVAIGGHNFYTDVRLRLTSGTPVSGEWSASFTVSKYARPGTYSINDLSVDDAARNTQDYPGYGTAPTGPNSLSLHPADNPTFTVTGTPATRPPFKLSGKLHSFSISPSKVNTTSASRLVHLVARFDGAAPSGVTVTLESAKRTGHGRFVFLHPSLRNQHGRWTGQVRVPRWIGRQNLKSGLVADFGSNFRPRSRSYDADHFHGRHFTGHVTVISGVDRTTPKITSISLSPNPVDSTAGPEKVTVTARASDTGSGVRSIEIDGGIRHGTNGVATGSYPFASAGVGFVSSQDFHVRLHRTAQRTWVGTATVRQCVPSGTYKLSAEVRDVAGNDRYYTSKELAHANVTSTVAVTSRHGDVVAPYVFSAATYGADHELFLNFSEGVSNVSTSTLTVFALAPRSSVYRSPMSVTGIVCSNGTETVNCSGDSGLVTSAVLTVPGMTPGSRYQVWGNLDQVVPQLTDGNRNPLDWNYSAADVVDA